MSLPIDYVFTDVLNPPIFLTDGSIRVIDLVVYNVSLVDNLRRRVPFDFLKRNLLIESKQ